MTEPDEEDKPISAQFEHCLNVWNEMNRQAADEPSEWTRNNDKEPSESTETLRIYEGHLTGLFRGLGLATPYYTSIRRMLVAMGCIEQIRRGGGAAQSRWVLRKPPEESVFLDYKDRRRAPSGKVAAMEQRVRNLEKNYQQLASAHERLALMVEAMRDDLGEMKVVT